MGPALLSFILQFLLQFPSDRRGSQSKDKVAVAIPIDTFFAASLFLLWYNGKIVSRRRSIQSLVEIAICPSLSQNGRSFATRSLGGWFARCPSSYVI